MTRKIVPDPEYINAIQSEYYVNREKRNKLGNSELRSLGVPRSIDVRVDSSGLPSVVHTRTRRTLRVVQIEEVWRIDEEWWKKISLSRTYYRVIVDGGNPLTLFRDNLATPERIWYEQRYR